MSEFPPGATTIQNNIFKISAPGPQRSESSLLGMIRVRGTAMLTGAAGAGSSLSLTPG